MRATTCGAIGQRRTAAAVLRLAVGRRARACARTGVRRGTARGLPRGGGRVRDQAERQPRRRAAHLRRRGSRERCALHRDRHARRAGAAEPGALPARCPARGARQLRLCERGDRQARTGRRRQDAGSRGDRRGCGARGGRARLHRRNQPPAAGREDAQRYSRREWAAASRGGHGLPAGDPDDRRVREAREPRGPAALRDGAPRRPVQGGGHDLAELRDDALLRARPMPRSRPTPPTCCSACASNAPSTAARWTGSSRPTTPRC